MKKILAWVLLLVMLLGMMAGCKQPVEEPDVTDPPEPSVEQPSDEPAPQGSTAEEAMAYLRAIYKDTEEPTPTPVNYDRYGIVRIAGVPFTIVWTVDVSEDLIKVVVNEDGSVTIDVNESCDVATPYTLTATITDEFGGTASHSWDMLLPAAADMTEIVKTAYQLAPGEALPYESTLRGEIIAINTVYSAEYKNITVTIAVEGVEDMPIECYRLKGEGAADLAVGNIITVTGTLKNYNGKIEFDAGCTLDAVEKGNAVETPTDIGTILKAAYNLADGEALPYPVTMTGTVTGIDSPYDPNYGNISVILVADGYSQYPILAFRLKGVDVSKIAINDKITVSGIIKNYKGKIEFDAGCQMLDRVSGGGVAQGPSSDATKILTDANKLAPGEKLPYRATLTGEIVTVDQAYDPGYGNVTVTMKVNGQKIQCYRLKGDGADQIRVTDKITVTGIIENYNGKLEFGSGCTLDSWTMGSRVIPADLGPLKTETAYILQMKQVTLGKVLFFTGTKDGSYLATSENVKSAVQLFVEQTEGKGVRFYFMNGQTKTYLELESYTNKDGKLRARPALVTTPSVYWTYETSAKVYTVELSGTKYFLGTYNDYSTISASSTYYITDGNAANVGKTQFVAEFVLPSEAGGDIGGETPDTPTTSFGTYTTAPEVGKAYKLGLDQTAKNETYYFTGVMSGYYGATETDYTKGVDVYLETAEGGYNLYFTDASGVKQYIYIVASGTHINFTFSAENKSVFVYDTTLNSLYTTLDGNVYYMGTYGNYVTVGTTAQSKVETSYVTHLYTDAGSTETPDTPDVPSTGVTVVDAPAAGTAYKFGMVQKNVSETDVYYLIGGMNGYYMATGTEAAAAIDVYLEETTGGYYLYTLVDGAKTYINMVVSGTHVNGAYEATASTVYTYDADAKTVIAQVNDAPYWFGTRNDKTYTTVGPVKTEYEGFYMQFYTVGSSEGGETPDLPADGSELTIAELLALPLADGETTSQYYIVKATVDSISNPAYGSMKVSDSTGSISVYNSKAADGTYYSDMADKPYKGDSVTLKCNVKNFKGTMEINQAYIIDFTHADVEIDLNEYKEMTIAAARDAKTGDKVKVTGVVARITYANGMKPAGLILVDNTSSIYVYDADLAGRCAIGNTVTIAASKTYWILESEQTNAAKYGYLGCNQLENVQVIEVKDTVSDFAKGWITETTVKDIMDTPVSQDITTKLFKVTAQIKKAEGTGFTNYYINDLDGKTGSYSYSQCNGSDFAWLDAFDGKICTVYLTALNAKSTSSGCNWRFLPVAVIDEGFDASTVNFAENAVKYYGVGQFLDTYTGDPALALLTSVDNELLGYTGAKLSYASSDTSVITVDGNVMHCLKTGTAKITVTGEYGGKTYSEDVTVEVKISSETIDAITVAEAIAADLDSTVTVKGIVGPFVVNQTGFYLIDETGVIAVLTDADTLATLRCGYEVVLEGTRYYKAKENLPGQTCISDAKIVANNYGTHEYSTASFKGNITAAEFYNLDANVDYTTTVYTMTAKVEFTETAYSANVNLVDGDTKIGLYCSNANSQYGWLKAYNGKTVTLEIAPCNWNSKTYYRGCVLAVLNEDGTKTLNDPNAPATPDTPSTPDTPDAPDTPATGDGILELTVDTMGIELQNYYTGTATVEGIGLDLTQIGNYGNGIQMRDKNGNTSILFNTTALPGKITKIELTSNANKTVYDNPDAVIFSFGTAKDNLTYSTKLSCVADQTAYTVTPDSGSYTFFKIEHDLGYTLYWDSIKVYYETASTPEDPCAKGHTEVVDAAVAATCTTAGKTEGKHCSVCNTVIVEQTEVAALGHTEVVDAAVAATCTTVGKTEGKHCSVCNTVLVAQTEVAALGHTEVVDAGVTPTCTATGLTNGKHCSVCNTVLVVQNVIPALGHTDDDNNFLCDICDADLCTTHTEEVIPGKAATCTEAGLTEGKKCSNCGEIIVAQTTITALGHTEVVDAAVAATCTTAGKTEGKHCSVCNTVTVMQTVVEALGHTEVVDAAVAATCTKTGLTEGKHCSVCNDVLVAQTVVDALGHTEVVDAAVAATCATAGKTEGKHCSVCNEVLVAQTEVAALGHKYTDNYCTVCGDPEVGYAFKFGMIQENVSETDVYYLIGGMDGYYMATSTSGAKAIDVYLEETTGGYYLYTLVDGTKTYINMVVSADGAHVNGAYEATASTVYTYDAEAKTIIANVNDADYWFGTRNDKYYTTVGPVKTEDEGFYCLFYTEVSTEGGDSSDDTTGNDNIGATVSALENGDQVIIYAPAYNKALSTEKVATYYNAGVDITVTDGVVTGYGDTEIWTVIVNDDGTYSFANGGQNIGLAAEYSSMNLGAVNDDWQIESLGGTLHNLKNTVRGNYMEWYSKYSNWSTLNTTDATTDDQLQLSFYVIGKGTLFVEVAGGDSSDDTTGDDTTTGNFVKLTVDSLGLESQAYTAGTATVSDVGFEWIQLGNYGNGIQMRDKDGNTSILWNTTATTSKITKIELTFDSVKSTYDNPDAVIFSFGNAADNLTYTTTLSTTAGQKTYTIVPEGDFTFFKLEHDLGYTMYWDSIVIYYEG